jgi:transcriptional regulator with XRE-family HTH domain
MPATSVLPPAVARVHPLKRELIKIRQQHGVSARVVAQEAGISESALSQIIAGNQRPSAETKAAIARALGVEPWQIFPPA